MPAIWHHCSFSRPHYSKLKSQFIRIVFPFYLISISVRVTYIYIYMAHREHSLFRLALYALFLVHILSDGLGFSDHFSMKVEFIFVDSSLFVPIHCVHFHWYWNRPNMWIKVSCYLPSTTRKTIGIQLFGVFAHICWPNNDYSAHGRTHTKHHLTNHQSLSS